NLMRSADDSWQGATSFTADGYPAPTDTNAYVLLSSPSNAYDSARGYGLVEDGLYTVMGDGASASCGGGTTDSSHTTVTEVTGTATVAGVGTVTLPYTGHATNNVRQFTVSHDGTHFGPFLTANIATGPATNLRIYPPGVATDGSQKFHPKYL